MKSLKTYLEKKYSPLPWTILDNHPDECLVGNDELVISFIRFHYIMQAVKKHFSSAREILDVGVFPGHMPQLFHEYFPGSGNYKYHGLGLGFTKEFREKMKDYGVELIECDLEPRLHLEKGRRTTIPLSEETIDSIIFTDVIEHFYDPFYPLQEINRVSKLGAMMILTTDNLTRFRAVLDIFRGHSCSVPLIQGNLFYNGDWRPHFREYSRSELFQLLKWAGFEVLEHNFYEAEFGNYHLVDGKLVKMDLRKQSIKKKLINWIQKLTIKILPHLRDNHILVAKKVKTYEEMMSSAPKLLSDMNEWINQRKVFYNKLKKS